MENNEKKIRNEVLNTYLTILLVITSLLTSYFDISIYSDENKDTVILLAVITTFTGSMILKNILIEKLNLFTVSVLFINTVFIISILSKIANTLMGV